MSEFVDYYEILEVHQGASQDVIAKAYKTLIFKNHPDRGGSEETAKRITGAYWVLSDPTRRAEYDREWQAAQAVGRDSYDAHYIRLEDIPPEVVDALLAATFVEMAKATARTAGRVAGTVAVAGAKAAGGAVKDGAIAAGDAFFRHLDAKDEEKRRKLKAEQDRQAAWDRHLRAMRDAEGWSPAVSAEAKTAHESLAKSGYGYLGSLDDNDLIWLCLRHPQAQGRQAALKTLGRRMSEGQLLAGQLSEMDAPKVIARMSDDPQWADAIAEGRYARYVSGRIVSPEELEQWETQFIRARRQHRLKLAMLALGIAAAIAIVNAPRLGLAL